MKLRFALPLLLVLANVGCQSFSQSKSAYSEAVSDLTKKRAASLRSVGWTIQNVNLGDGFVLAKKATPFHPPRADSSVLQNAPIFLATSDCVFNNGKNTSSVTGYWTGK